MKHRTAVIQTKKQKQTWVDMWTDWCTKHRQNREGRKLDVTRTKYVYCRDQKAETGHLLMSFCPWESLKSIFLPPLSLSLSLSLSLFLSWIPLPIFCCLILFFFLAVLGINSGDSLENDFWRNFHILSLFFLNSVWACSLLITSWHL